MRNTLKRLGWGGVLLAALAAPTAQADDLLTFKLECNNGVFKPRTLQVPAGKKFKIEITNTGTEPIEFESKPLRKEKALNPGGTSFVVIFPLEPGSYGFFDDFHMQQAPGSIVAQ